MEKKNNKLNTWQVVIDETQKMRQIIYIGNFAQYPAQDPLKFYL